MQITKLLYTLLLCATAQQSLTVKKQDNTVHTQTEAEKAQAAFTAIIDKIVEQHNVHHIIPTNTQIHQADQQALKMVQRYPSLLTEENISRVSNNPDFRETRLYMLQRMLTHPIKRWDFYIAMRTGDIAAFDILSSRIIVSGRDLFDTFFDAIVALDRPEYPWTETEKQEARMNQTKILEKLISIGADVNKPIEIDEKDMMPLSAAIKLKRDDIKELLIKNGAKL